MLNRKFHYCLREAETFRVTSWTTRTASCMHSSGRNRRGKCLNFKPTLCISYLMKRPRVHVRGIRVWVTVDLHPNPTPSTRSSVEAGPPWSSALKGSNITDWMNLLLFHQDSPLCPENQLRALSHAWRKQTHAYHRAAWAPWKKVTFITSHAAHVMQWQRVVHWRWRSTVIQCMMTLSTKLLSAASQKTKPTRWCQDSRTQFLNSSATFMNPWTMCNPSLLRLVLY